MIRRLVASCVLVALVGCSSEERKAADPPPSGDAASKKLDDSPDAIAPPKGPPVPYSTGQLGGYAPYRSPGVGQWVFSRRTAGSSVTYVYEWIVGVEPGSDFEGPTVEVHQQLVDPEMKTGKPAASRRLTAGANRGGAGANVWEDEVVVGAKTLPCRRVEYTRDEGKTALIHWVTNEVPLHGLARQVDVKDGKVVSRTDVLAFGESGGADRPSR